MIKIFTQLLVLDCRIGPSINDVASLEGGRGAKLTIRGYMRGVGVKENPTSSIQDWQITSFSFILLNAIYFNFLETDFMNIPRLKN